MLIHDNSNQIPQQKPSGAPKFKLDLNSMK